MSDKLYDENDIKKEYKGFIREVDDCGENLKRLNDIVRVLRRECPWDKVQTHSSLKSCMIEEAYEAVDAINRNDFENLREELGDVLLQVVFHGLLAEEEGKFLLNDVINDEIDKMIRRHPHIFFHENLKTIDKVLEKWENMKSREHCDSNITDRLRRVPLTLPATTRSFKLQKRAAQIGFDFSNVSQCMDKVEEEFEEFKEALSQGDKAHTEEELGDLLFSVINVARKLDINPEEALDRCNNKFITRFSKMEELATEDGVKLETLDIAAMDMLWEKSKANL